MWLVGGSYDNDTKLTMSAMLIVLLSLKGL